MRDGASPAVQSPPREREARAPGVASGGPRLARGPSPRAWRRRNGQLLVFRGAVGLLAIGLLSLPTARGPLDLGLAWVFAAVALIAGVNLAFYALTRWWPWLRGLAAAQIAVDLVLVQTLVYLTGGTSSAFAFLPFACVVAAAVVLGGYASLFYASLATVLMAAISLAYSLAYVGYLHLPGIAPEWVDRLAPTFARTIALVGGNAVALHLVAVLGGHLAARLRRETILKDEILDIIAEGLIVADQNLRVVFANAEARRLLGFERADQLIGKRWEEVFRRRGDRQVRLMLSVPASRSRVIEFDHRTKGRLFLSVKVRPFRAGHEAIGGVVAIFYDITAERLMEAVQERAERLREISLVAAGLAHELRNPLASIRGCVQELAQRRHAEGGMRHADRLTDIIIGEADRLDKIITEFLDFARMRPPRPTPCDLGVLVAEVVTLLRAGHGLSRVEVVVDIVGRITLLADREQLRQVLLNLARNAVEAMPDGGRLTLAANLVAELPGDAADERSRDARTPPAAVPRAVRIEIADTGAGIAPEDVAKLFTPFFTTKPAGTGMGLSIVERIVRAHDGHIEVESHPRIGSTFRLWLPLELRRRPAEADLWESPSVEDVPRVVGQPPSAAQGDTPEGPPQAEATVPEQEVIS
jgi:two-component system sensor histidine kinase PilS (NtrC family)